MTEETKQRMVDAKYDTKSTTTFPIINTWGDRKIMRLHAIRHDKYGQVWHCGYVTLHKNHPVTKFYLYNRDVINEINVHGGITYDHYSNEDETLTLGFDCNHYMDDMEGGINKDASYVVKETKFLADQLSGDIIKVYVANEVKRLQDEIKTLRSYE